MTVTKIIHAGLIVWLYLLFVHNVSLFKVHMQTEIVRRHISFNVTNCSNYPDEAQR